MRKFTGSFLVVLLLLSACQRSEVQNTKPEDISSSTDNTQRKCAAQEVLEQQLAADPSMRARRAAIENHTRTAIAEGRVSPKELVIPVVVHVVYSSAAENISDAQINSQIAVLNEDFNLGNADASQIPAHFDGVKGDVGIRFVLDRVIRKQSNRKYWGMDDNVKRSSRGGSDAVDPTTYLNMWSCNLGQNLLGYAQFPGGPLETDGIVVLYSAVGSRDKAAGTYVSNYDLGRTATHEIGHWLNLFHIWGDATCGNDEVGDTPLHNTANTGCPPADHRSTCTGTPLEMWMNYMDYTYDRCMYMFSEGQKNRMLAVVSPGGPRAALAN